MAHCVYCQTPSRNVIEVRYARPLAQGQSGRGAAQEVVGRGYEVCDGCLALLDFRPEHHIDPQRISAFNLASSIYQAFAVWAVTALSSLASLSGNSAESLLVNPRFQALGFLLVLGSGLVWALRTYTHLRYFLDWKEKREKPVRPMNSLAGFTNLRDRMHPELAGYLPVRFSDSNLLLEKPGSISLRSISPDGTPWGEAPQKNLEGRGANGWYRLIWISWDLWPLSEVLDPPSSSWSPPPEPAVGELEAGAAGLFAASSFAVFSLATVLHPLAAFGAALASWPVGFFAGRQARELWRAYKNFKSSQKAA